jgi:hypothetical protein
MRESFETGGGTRSAAYSALRAPLAERRLRAVARRHLGSRRFDRRSTWAQVLGVRPSCALAGRSAWWRIGVSGEVEDRSGHEFGVVEHGDVSDRW